MILETVRQITPQEMFLKASIFVGVEATIRSWIELTGSQILNFKIFMTPKITRKYKNGLISDQVEKQEDPNRARITFFGALQNYRK